MRESVSKLESDIIKTIANNDRLKGSQLEIEKLIKQWEPSTDGDEEEPLIDEDDEIVTVDELQPDAQVNPSSEKVSIIFVLSSHFGLEGFDLKWFVVQQDCASLVYIEIKRERERERQRKNASVGDVFCFACLAPLVHTSRSSILYIKNIRIPSLVLCKIVSICFGALYSPGLASGVIYLCFFL